MTPSRWKIVAECVLAVLMLGAVAGRIALWLHGTPFWLDEQLIALNLRGRDYGQLIGKLWHDQSAPIGWLWAQRFMLENFGDGELSLRFIPMLSGCATVVAAWLIARRFFNFAGALALTGLTAVNIGLVTYSLELKSYATDALFSMVLTGLAMWVLQQPQRQKRWLAWWAVAAVGSLLSMGAALVVPGLFVVLISTLWRQAGWKAALRAWAPGLVWFAAFATNYFLAVQANATGSSYMKTFWARGMSPQDGGLAGFAVWLAKRFANLAEDPVYAGAGIGDGSRYWHIYAGIPFWLLVLIGLIVAWRRRPALGLLIAAPIATAFVLATLRIVPLMARLALWLLPVLFIAIAFAMDGAAIAVRQHHGAATGRPRLLRRLPLSRLLQRHKAATGRPRLLRRLPLSRLLQRKWIAALALLALLMLVPYTQAVWAWMTGPGLHDDRASVAWMKENHRPGDIVLVTGNSGRALEWYDPDRILDPSLAVLSTKDKTCTGELAKAVKGYQRAVIYAGARIAPWEGTPAAAFAELKGIGKVLETKQFTGFSVVMVVDLTAAPDGPAPSSGCVYLG